MGRQPLGRRGNGPCNAFRMAERASGTSRSPFRNARERELGSKSQIPTEEGSVAPDGSACAPIRLSSERSTCAATRFSATCPCTTSGRFHSMTVDPVERSVTCTRAVVPQRQAIRAQPALRDLVVVSQPEGREEDTAARGDLLDAVRYEEDAMAYRKTVDAMYSTLKRVSTMRVALKPIPRRRPPIKD